LVGRGDSDLFKSAIAFALSGKIKFSRAMLWSKTDALWS
jgi:hypothetical protein